MIRKAKAVCRGIGRAGSGNLSTGSQRPPRNPVPTQKFSAMGTSRSLPLAQIHPARRSYR